MTTTTKPRAATAYRDWGIRCATLGEFAAWYAAACRADLRDHRALDLGLFCWESEPAWCREMRSEGLCCKVRMAT